MAPAGGVRAVHPDPRVTPANLYMWQHPDLFPSFPPTLLAARLALQAFLLGCILALMLARDEAPLARR